MTLGFNPNGLNSSLSLNSVNLGTVTNNGFQAGSQNWVQENISAAQSNAGAGGDQWLEGKLDDFVEGIKGIPEVLASLPQEAINSITSTIAESFGSVDFRLDRLLEGNFHIGEGGFLDFGNSSPSALAPVPVFYSVLVAILESFTTGGLIYCAANDCGEILNSEDPDKEKKEPEKPKPARDTNLTEKEAQEMRDQGLNPLDSKDVDKYLDGTRTERDNFKELTDFGSINPKKIRFSQDSISSDFQDGNSVKELTRQLISGKIKPEEIPPIRIVEKDGLIYSLDNRRLKAFQDAGLPIRYKKLYNIPQNQQYKFTTKNNGISIEVR